MRKVIAAVLLSSTIVGAAGCFDASEVDDILHVTTLGIDLGVTDKWRITIQFPTLKEGGGGGGGSSGGGGAGGGGYSIATIDSPSFFEGINMLAATLPRRINFMQTQDIVFSEDLAKSSLIGEYLAPISRFREIRRSAHVFVTKGKAFDFLQAYKPVVGSSLSKNMLIQLDESRRTGFFPNVSLEEFYSSLKAPKYRAIATIAAVNNSSAFVAEGERTLPNEVTGGHYTAGSLPRTGENKIELFGTAVFNGDIMAGELNGDETRCMLMLRGEFHEGYFIIKDPLDPDLVVPLDIKTAGRPQIKVKIIDSIPHIDVKISLQGDLLAVQSGIEYEQRDLKTLLENTFIQRMKSEITKVVEKCKALNVDAFKFGNSAVKEFLTIDDFEAYGWNDRFKDAQVNVDVDFVVRRTGTQIRISPVRG